MRTITAFDPVRRLLCDCYRYLCGLFIAFGTMGSMALAEAPASAPAASSYRVIQLETDRYAFATMNARGQVAINVRRNERSRVVFYDGQRLRDFGTLGGTSATVAGLNDRGQIAFNVDRSGIPRAMFYDGRRVVDIGTLGGRGATAAGLNELGQIAGAASIAGTRATLHPYRWSRGTGMVDLGAAGQGNLVVLGINDRGYVYGRATFPGSESTETHGFFWSPRSGILDIGALGEFSMPSAMNEAGTIVGYGGTGPFSVIAFRWTRASGISDMGSLPDDLTVAIDINRAGQVVGGTPFVAEQRPHPFLWSPGQGLLDLGVGTAERGAGTEVNEHGMVIGYLREFFYMEHGFIWTRETGLIEIGAADRSLLTWAADVNNRGQVVGSIGECAFIWTRAQSFVDLNTLVTDAPTGLVFNAATAISETGAILATAETGLYLLAPREGPRRADALR